MKNHGRNRDEKFVTPEALNRFGHMCETVLWVAYQLQSNLRRQRKTYRFQITWGLEEPVANRAHIMYG